MAVVLNSNQYKYTGRGPIDGKTLVATFDELLSTSTWNVGTVEKPVSGAYNGMITAVWLNKADTSKNGIYFLFDPSIVSKLKTPDVTNSANWHKLAELSDLADFTTRLSTIETELEAVGARLTALEEDSDVITYDYRSGFPVEGEEGKLYVAADEKKSYVWFNGEYLVVSGSDGGSYEEPDVIYGGSAD